MKIIAIVTHDKDGTEIVKTIGRISPQTTLLELHEKIQAQRDGIGADMVTEILLDIEA